MNHLLMSPHLSVCIQKNPTKKVNCLKKENCRTLKSTVWGAEHTWSLELLVPPSEPVFIEKW